MNLPEYITKEEVQRVCRELGFRDWTQLSDAPVLPEEARKILEMVNVEKMPIALEDFIAGLEVELEHGVRFHDANVTNNHPILTGKIVLAHLKETLDYYQRLEVAELEGDLLHAVADGNLARIEKKYAALVQARLALSRVEAAVLGKK